MFLRQVQPGLAVPQGGAGVDHAGAGHRPATENQLLREGHLLLLRRAELAQGSQGVPTRVRQVRGPTTLAPDASSQS